MSIHGTTELGGWNTAAVGTGAARSQTSYRVAILLLDEVAPGSGENIRGGRGSPAFVSAFWTSSHIYYMPSSTPFTLTLASPPRDRETVTSWT